MITVRHVATHTGEIINHTIKSEQDREIDGTGLTLLPALIDPHVHFRIPGAEHKENWESGARAAIAGGVTTVLDMPNNDPACVSQERLMQKKEYIEKQLQRANIPLRYGLYIGASEQHLGEIEKVNRDAIGIKVFLGSSTGDLLLTNPEAFENVCRIAAQHSMVVAVHAEDEAILQEKKKQYPNTTNVRDHSRIRDPSAAIAATEKAIAVSQTYGNRLYLLHASTKEEVSLVREAKKKRIDVWLETTPHHLFLSTSSYDTLGTRAQMNPPLRTTEDAEALWQGIKDGTIDTIGTDHAPHTIEEKSKPYGEAPSGVPGIENYLGLLLDAVNNGKISLSDVVRLTSKNPAALFRLSPHDDVVLVDMKKKKTIRDVEQKTKCGWSPYAGMELQGWPVYTILRRVIYTV